MCVDALVDALDRAHCVYGGAHALERPRNKHEVAQALLDAEFQYGIVEKRKLFCVELCAHDEGGYCQSHRNGVEAPHEPYVAVFRRDNCNSGVAERFVQ